MSTCDSADETRPANPVPTGTRDTSGCAEDVVVSGNYVYLTTGKTGLKIIDSTDPANPVLTEKYDTPDESRGLFVAGNNTYVADTSALLIFGISIPSQPELVGTYPSSFEFVDVYVSGDYIYVLQSGTDEILVILQFIGH